MPNQAMSGVVLKEEVTQAFEDMKLGKPGQRYILMKLTDDLKEIEIEKKGPKTESHADFMAQLPKDDCRYAFVDYTFQGQETGGKDLLLFVVWCPDTAKIKKKMLYASSKDAVKSKCHGFQAEIQANDFDEISEEAFAEKCKGKK